VSPSRMAHRRPRLSKLAVNRLTLRSGKFCELPQRSTAISAQAIPRRRRLQRVSIASPGGSLVRSAGAGYARGWLAGKVEAERGIYALVRIPGCAQLTRDFVPLSGSAAYLRCLPENGVG